MGDDTEWLKLPIDEKITHKAWKARMAGYEEAIKQWPMLDEKSPEFGKYLGLVKKMVTDTNAIAQEKALEAVLIYVENAHSAGKAAGEVCSGIVTKCLNSARAKTKERAFEILMMYVEIERQDIVQDELMKGLTNKQPKVVAGCVVALTMALRDFGNKIIQIKPLLKPMQKLLEDRDKTVRDETKQLVIQMYRWVGAPLKPQLASLKPVQIQELEAEFEKLPSGKAHQARYLRSQQDLKEKAEAAAAAGSGDEEDEDEEDGAGADMDPYELMEAVDILGKMPKDFYDKIEAKKWQERREALEAVDKLLETPKLESGDYGDLMRALKKVIAKDTNIMLVQLAAKIAGKLAVGLRKKFAPYANQLLESLLEKFREKKVTVVAVLTEAVDAVFLTTTLDAISETVVEYLSHKTPSVRAETCLFLSRCFSRCTTATLPKKLLKLFIGPLLKNKDDSDAKVREAAFCALGMAMKVIGEKAAMAFLADVDPLKMAKIKENYDKSVLVSASGKPKAEKAKKEEKPAAAAAAPAKKAGGPPKAIRGGGGKKKPGAAAASSSDSSQAGRPGTSKGAAGKKGAKGKKGDAKEEVMENALSDEAVEEKVGGLLPSDTITGLSHANWKERLASMEKFTAVIKTMERAEIPCQACVRTVNKKPGLKETNFQVMKLRVELIAHLATNSNFSKRSAEFCLTDLVDKLGDAKNGAAVKEALSCIAEACKLEFVSQEVIVAAFEQKNPKNQAEALNWLAGAIKEFGFKVNIKPMLQYIKKAFAHTNPAVRTAAITLVGVAYMYMGAPLRIFFEDEKAALVQQIDAEIEKVKGEKPPAATRGLTAAGGGEEDDEEEEEGGGAEEEASVLDLVPRNDISEQLKESLMTEMADKNWKVRNEALQKVMAILNEAKFITPNIPSLPEALKLRLGDSNKILVGTTLSICTTLATAMGPGVKQHVRVIGPGIVSCMGDSKPQVRASAVNCLNTWVEQTNLPIWVEAEIFSDGLKTETPNLRIELLGWLAQKLPDAKKLPSEEIRLCIPHLFSCLEDRNGEVRKRAQEAVLPLMIHTGFESMARAAGKLKPASKEQIMGHLEKAKPNLPAKPVKAKSAKAAPAAAAAPPPPAAVEEPEEPPDVPVVKGGGGKGKGKPGAKKGAAAAATSKKKKGAEEEDVGPPMKFNNLKDQRMKDEKQLKVLKWNFTAPRGEFVDQLRTQMEPSFSVTLMTQLFHNDFKQHVKALDVLIKCVDTLPDAMTANLDLILKWVTLRFFDTNTSVLLKILDYLQQAFNSLANDDYHMLEPEASSFIPYLVNKVGDPKDNIRRDIRTILKIICKIYPASKMFSFILDGLKSKNSKQRTECLDELGILIEVYGINVCQPSPAGALKLIAGQIGNRDNSVRSAALNTCVIGHSILGENVYKYIGKLNDKDMDMLEERIKRASKSRPASVVKVSPEEKPQKVVRPREQPAQRANPAPVAAAPVVEVNDNRGGHIQHSSAKKEFYLEIDEGEDGTNYQMPKLIEHDLDNLLEESPSLPKTRVRPPSPSTKLITGSTDAKSAIDLVISQVASNDINTSVQALAQIDEVLKDETKCEMMGPHVDQFLVACSLQLRMTYSKHISDEGQTDNVVRLYRCLLASLLALFQKQSIARQATRDVLRDLIPTLITILLDARLNELEDGPQVVRTVNVVVVKIVGNSDHTNIMSALIKLLHETITNENCTTKFQELIMKCLWKLIRMLPTIIDQIQVDRTLADLHQFLQAFPSSTWRQRPNDQPLRTIKTILHSLVKLKGNKIMSHLTLIENPQDSEMEVFLEKLLKSGIGGGGINTSNTEHMNGSTDGVVLRTPKKDSSSSSSSRRLSRTTHDTLAEIFKKIGSKENTKEGLNDLYDFKQKCPEADLEPFLKKSSHVFQKYIERGLKNIEIEREGKLGVTPLSTSNSASVLNNGSGADGDANMNPAIYMERLKALRAKCGLDRPDSAPASMAGRSSEKLETGSLSSHTTSSSSASLPQVLTAAQPDTETENQPPPDSAQSAAANLLDLKKRLERIKKTAAS